MAGSVYDVGAPYLVTGIASATIKAMAVDTGYTFSASHSMADVAAHRCTGTDDPTLGAVAFSDGVLSNDATASLGIATEDLKAVVVYKFVTDDTDSIPLTYGPASGTTTANGNGKIVTFRLSGAGGIVTVS